MLQRLRHSGIVRSLFAAWVAAWLSLIAVPCLAAGAPQPNKSHMAMAHQAAAGQDCNCPHHEPLADDTCGMAQGPDCNATSAPPAELATYKLSLSVAPPPTVPELPREPDVFVKLPIATYATAPPVSVSLQLRYCTFLE